MSNHNHYSKHLINEQAKVIEALSLLDKLGADAILFVVNKDYILLGSMTDGDIRRGLIKGFSVDQSVTDFIQPNPKFIRQGKYDLKEIISLRARNYAIFPVLNDANQVINVVNFKRQKSYLPVDALIMAGGRGERLRPLTDTLPKPLLLVGDKPILEHNIDRLNNFGVDDIWISVKYLGNLIEDFFGNGTKKSIRIKYVYEKEALGTAGALALVEDFIHDTVLVMNSDLLTNIDFEDFYLYFLEQEADLAVACIPYKVTIPYAVMETNDKIVTGFVEKPTYTHYSNAGIYLIKREVLSSLLKGQHYNATDLMDDLIKLNKKVIAYPLLNYWLDIGQHEDYKKAQEDIKNIKF